MSKELIARARCATGPMMGEQGSATRNLANVIEELCDALEAALPPEGWTATEYTKDDGVFVALNSAGSWAVFKPAHLIPVPGTYSSAKAAMEAMEKNDD